jgi:4-amino-4-deoxy-L-arabinose transferase-like glycosyltransferase
MEFIKMKSLKKGCVGLKKQLYKEIVSHRFIYLLLGIVLVLGFFVRVYRAGDLMGFYYDQGRDALVIWRLWYEGKPFLIGPVTGLAGIFLGPFYYYLIAPFYLIGSGNPIYPAVFLAFLTICGVFMLYYLGWKFQDRTTGLFAAIIGSFSYYLVLAGRWLSNPTPILLTSMLFLWSLWMITQSKKKYWWIIAVFLIGISLQLESASAVFYLLVLAVFAIWQRKKFPDAKTLLYSGLMFFVTLVPQILFNIRHDNLLVNNFIHEIFKKESFKLSFWQVFSERLNYIWTVFHSKILPENMILVIPFSLLSFYSIYKFYKKNNIQIKLLLIYLFVPIIGYFLFQGNQGNIYDYYMTGYYFPMVLLFSIGLGILWKKVLGKIAVIVFFIIFASINFQMLTEYLGTDLQEENLVVLGNEIKAVDWVMDDAKNKGEYNVLIYVPPVIPYSYEYLFLWRANLLCGDNNCGYIKDAEREFVYLIFEKDIYHPWRLETWLKNNEGVGELGEEVMFGGITVQRRHRD